MEDIPVEVIGSILSRVGSARDVVFASLTCRKWQEAWRNHLHTLAFNSYDWPVYDVFMRSTLEIIITRTILQTKALQSLSIIMKNDVEFTTASVISWLMGTSDTLRQLKYNVNTPDLNILEISGVKRLEVLDLAYNTIARFPSYRRFLCLRFLSLAHVKISTLDLSCWLSACPKVEVLILVNLDVGTNSSMELSSNSLKYIGVKMLKLKKVILNADSLEQLHLVDCNINTFKLKGKGRLRVLVLDEVIISHLDIGESAKNIEIVVVCNFTISRSDFYHMIAKLSKARRMSLYGYMFADDINEFVDSETTTTCFPQLTHLSLTYEFGQALQGGLLGFSQFENVVEVELRWRLISHLESHWVVELLQRCPKLRKLVIAGAVSCVNTLEECRILSNFTTYISKLLREYGRVHLEFRFA